MPQGASVFVDKIETDKVGFHYKEHHYSLEIYEFEQQFEFDPEGEERARERALKLLQDIDRMAQSDDEVLLLDEPKALPGSVAEETGAALDTIQKMTPEGMRKKMYAVVNQTLKARKELKKKQKEVKELVEQKVGVLQGQLEKYGRVADIAQEALLTINLYLGANEHIVQIREGEAASPDTPIHIRQQVLYMDEECAIAPEQGGIDAQGIEAFDQWISVPENLQQVFPEEKGLCALKPRRKDKKYIDNPIANAAMNEGNFETYILLRNGERLYRLCSDVKVGEVLFPKSNMFDKYFISSEWDGKTRRPKEVTLKPGSWGYSRAMEKAQSEQRHFMRIFLFLQGLLDRTPIFKPYPIPYINLCDRDQHGRYLKFISDADMLLPSGRLPFIEWRKEVNSKLKIGDRVVGFFGYEQIKHDEDRLWPRHASYPNSLELYALETKEGRNGFRFRYKREDEIWSMRFGYHKAKKRASCVVYLHDDFILNFDEVQVEDMEFYLQSRVDREHYVEMIPLLKTVIAMKHQETQKEKPFRQLLQSEFIKRYELNPNEAELAVDELIRWWKFKTKIHRALTSDDKKAYRMIIRRGERYLKQKQIRVRLEPYYDWIVKKITQCCQNVLLITHVEGYEFKVLIPMNDENIFVREELYKVSIHNKAVTATSQIIEWRIITPRYQAWKIIYASKRWDVWEKQASRNSVLSDPEIDDLFTQARECISEAAKEHLEAKEDEDESDYWHEQKKWDFVRLLMLVKEGHTDDGWRVYYWVKPAVVDPKHVLTAKLKEPHCREYRIKWYRNRFGLHCQTKWSNSEPVHNILRLLDGKYRIFWQDKQVIAQLQEEHERTERFDTMHDHMRDHVHAIRMEVEKAVQQQCREQRKQKYLSDGGEEELWEEYEQSLSELPYVHCDLYNHIAVLVERDIEVKGQTVKQIIRRAKQFGVGKPKEKEAYDGREFDELPLDYVIQTSSFDWRKTAKEE